MRLEIKEGLDVGQLIGIRKYEKPIDLSLAGDAIGNFPTNLISITDEFNGNSYPRALDEIQEGTELYITQKVDGSSVSFIVNGGEFFACSRKLMLKEGSGFPWLVASKYNLKEKLLSLKQNLAIQGEAIGSKLNGNRLQINGIEIRLFRAKNLDTQEYYSYDQLKELATKLDIPMVEEIERIKFNKSLHTTEYFQSLANKQIYQTNKKPAEGIVVASIIPTWNMNLQKNFSIKFINMEYKQD